MVVSGWVEERTREHSSIKVIVIGRREERNTKDIRSCWCRGWLDGWVVGEGY